MEEIITKDNLNTYTLGLKGVLSSMGEAILNGSGSQGMELTMEFVGDDNAYAVVTSGTKTIGTYHINETAVIPYGLQYSVQVYDGNGNMFPSLSDSADVMGRTFHYDFIFADLGLPSGTLWARKNVGAESAEDFGLYFSWGNIDGHAKGSGYNFSENVYSGTTGKSLKASFTPGDARYDAATANIGNSYKMPTKTQLLELLDSCTWVYTTKNGKLGYIVKGPSGDSIFMPIAGAYDSTNYTYTDYGMYWSTTYTDSAYAYHLSLSIYYGKNVGNNGLRYMGRPIRAVKNS